MKHTIKTPQGTLTIEPVGKGIDPGVRVTVQKLPFPAFPMTIRPEDARAVHIALGMVLVEVGGVRCHGDACAAGQLACPTPGACGVR